MKSKWLLIAVLNPFLSFSQQKTPGSSLTSIASVGVVAGESTAKPLFQVSGGLRVDRHFAGIGFGMDPYVFKSIPLFADYRINIDKKGTAFAYANGGYNFPYDNKNYEDFFKTTDHFYGGFYMDAGLGYRVRLSSLHRLLISAGYSQKNINNTIGYTYFCSDPPCEETVSTYHYTLGRIVTKLSWEFGK